VAAPQGHRGRLVRRPGAAPRAALAFYTVFALAPGLVILIPLTGVFLGSRAARVPVGAGLDKGVDVSHLGLVDALAPAEKRAPSSHMAQLLEDRA
jgi:hypothetical protein